jgi:hypothetical protein
VTETAKVQVITPASQTTLQVVQQRVQGINWPQTWADGGVAFLAALFAFGLALWEDRRKRRAEDKVERQKEAQQRTEQFVQEMKESARRRKAEEDDRKERTQILVIGLLRELKRAFELFRIGTSELKYPRAQNLYETYVLESTTKEQLELLKDKEILDKLAELRPDLMAFKHYYLDALKYHKYIDHFQNKVTPEYNLFSEAVSQMQTMLAPNKTRTRDFCILLKKFAPDGVTSDLDAEKWGL